MKYKGKIIQIIEEKKAGNFIMVSKKNLLPNLDYLNIRPAEERDVPKKYRKILWSIMGILGGLFFIGLITDSLKLTHLPGILGVILIALFLLAVGIGQHLFKKYGNKYVPKGIWYFDFPVPIEKPHDYKVGDLVEIELNLSKVKA